MLAFFAKDFGSEGFNGRAFFPRIQRQTGFAAGLLQEGCAVPSVLDGDLGQEQAATAMPGNEKSVAAHFNLFGTEWLRRRENAELNFEMRSLFLVNRGKAVILESRGP